jgi:hypothetical protein
MDLKAYDKEFIEHLNHNLAIYKTIGMGQEESPMWFQFNYIKNGLLYFYNSHRRALFFTIEARKEHEVWIAHEFEAVYEHFRQLKYNHIKTTAPTVYSEIKVLHANHK